MSDGLSPTFLILFCIGAAIVTQVRPGPCRFIDHDG